MRTVPAAALATYESAAEEAERLGRTPALWRALAEDLVAPRPLPPFDNSQMDGYALRAALAARELDEYLAAESVPFGLGPGAGKA